jgi:hypothetical protein
MFNADNVLLLLRCSCSVVFINTEPIIQDQTCREYEFSWQMPPRAGGNAANWSSTPHSTFYCNIFIFYNDVSTTLNTAPLRPPVGDRTIHCHVIRRVFSISSSSQDTVRAVPHTGQPTVAIFVSTLRYTEPIRCYRDTMYTHPSKIHRQGLVSLSSWPVLD